jgi:hypothetical protein
VGLGGASGVRALMASDAEGAGIVALIKMNDAESGSRKKRSERLQVRRANRPEGGLDNLNQ